MVFFCFVLFFWKVVMRCRWPSWRTPLRMRGKPSANFFHLSWQTSTFPSHRTVDSEGRTCPLVPRAYSCPFWSSMTKTPYPRSLFLHKSLLRQSRFHCELTLQPPERTVSKRQVLASHCSWLPSPAQPRSIACLSPELYSLCLARNIASTPGPTQLLSAVSAGDAVTFSFPNGNFLFSYMETMRCSPPPSHL